MPKVFEDLGVPAPVAAGLARLREDLIAKTGEDLVSMALYGGLARKRYYPGRSDINLFLVLRSAGVDVLGKVAPVLHQAWRSFLVEPLLITPEELEPAARDFPTKFLDIKNHHLLLAGRNVLSSLTVSPDHVRLRLEQELRNMQMRLRRRFLAGAQTLAPLTLALREAARPLAVVLATLLFLKGKPVPEDYQTGSIFSQAAQAFGFDGPALADLAGLRSDPGPLADPVALFSRVLNTIARGLEILQKE